MTLHNHPERNLRPEATLALFDKLDAISRERALTDFESYTLERVQNLLMHSRTYGLRKELASRGIPLRRQG